MVEPSLIDYTKFKLKPAEEIKQIFKEAKKIFIFWCGKCYKRFEENTEEEYDKLSEALNKTVKSLNLAEKKWADAGRQPSGTLYNSYKAVLKEVKKNKEDADINQPKILEIEKDKLKDLWK